jgi:manganese/iron transport system substrate-binding protein
MRLKLATIYILIILLLVNIGYISTSSFASETKKLTIVCSTTQIADFTRQVVGDRAEVLCILAPGADPHTYQPTPRDVGMVLRADICFQNGLHLEGKNWMKNLADDARKRILTCTDGIVPLKLPGEGEPIPDPHSWFTPANAAIFVQNITVAVCEIDPDGKTEYKNRAKLYLQQLRTLHSWILEQVNSILPERRILVTSHDAFNYFCHEYGFVNQAPVGWSTGSEVGAGMTPKRRTAVVNSIRDSGVGAIFVETSVNPKLIRELAREAGVEIGGELYSDSMGKAGSAGETYIGMMRENVIKIVTALK